METLNDIEAQKYLTREERVSYRAALNNGTLETWFKQYKKEALLEGLSTINKISVSLGTLLTPEMEAKVAEFKTKIEGL